MKPITSLLAILRLALFLTILAAFPPGAPLARAEAPQNYVSQALQGDLSNIGETLEDEEFLEQFRARFITRSDGLDLSKEDPLVRAVGGRYQDYWRDALLDPGQRDALEKTLAKDIIKILRENGVSSWNLNTENYQDHLSGALEKRGYYGIFGRTMPLLEFMVWKENNQTTAPVELTDGFQEARVYYLGDFVSLGWASFATFGGPSTGGWANDDGLFVVAEKWDLESENYKVSFLKHEARHFADYGLYPELEGADLEYRAKLTELSFAEKTVFDLLEKFTDHAARVDNAPHPLANWHVITDMSRELLGASWPASPDVWENIPVEKIQAAARKLLLLNDQDLARVGATTTSGIIKP